MFLHLYSPLWVSLLNVRRETRKEKLLAEPKIELWISDQSPITLASKLWPHPTKLVTYIGMLRKAIASCHLRETTALGSRSTRTFGTAARNANDFLRLARFKLDSSHRQCVRCNDTTRVL